MKNLLIILTIILGINPLIFGQEKFEFTEPKFSFTLINGWKEHKQNLNPNYYNMSVKVNENGRIGGILRVYRDFYLGSFSSIWDLNKNEEQKLFEKDADIENFTFSKEVLFGRRVVKLHFKTTIKEGNESENFEAVVYKYLLQENNKDYVISFFLITSPRKFKEDKKDLIKMLKTASFSENVDKNSKRFIFKGEKYKITKPDDYHFFDKSKYKDKSIKDVTKSHLQPIEVVDFEMLIPKGSQNKPTIHFYSYMALLNQKITQDKFNESKQFWTESYFDGTLKKLSHDIFNNSDIIKNFGKYHSKIKGFIVIEDNDHILSTLTIIKASKDTIKDSAIVITNHIYINSTVILIKLVKNYNSYSDLNTIKKTSTLIKEQFLEDNY